MTPREGAIKKIGSTPGAGGRRSDGDPAWQDSGRYESLPCRRLRSPMRPRAPMVSGLFRGPAVRAVKVAIAEALRTDDAVSCAGPTRADLRGRTRHASGAAELSR